MIRFPGIIMYQEKMYRLVQVLCAEVAHDKARPKSGERTSEDEASLGLATAVSQSQQSSAAGQIVRMEKHLVWN